MSVLNGKKIIFLGSSVTKGFAAYGKSFVDMLSESTGCEVIKEAVSGTTLVDNGEKSYVARLKKIDKNFKADLFVLQLSTNDATLKKPLGKLGEGKDINSFDTSTVIGAIEYIFAYVKQTWNCPVVIYTNPAYFSAEYKAMVEALPEVAKKWDVQVLDMWHDEEVNRKENKKWTNMNDQIHPTRKGYTLWTPIFEKALSAAVEGKKFPERAKVAEPVTDAAIAKKKTGSLVKKILLAVLAVVLVLGGTIGLSTYEQLVTVKGLKNEGNSEKYDPENTPALASQPIKGKKLFWLGSSVFQGFGAANTSPAKWVDAQEGTVSVIEVKGGTFLASVNGEIGNGLGSIDASTSYTNRLKNHDATTDPDIDLVVVQLSTNDSKGFCPLGEVLPASKKDFNDFDLTTTAGSLEAITAYARDVWGARTLVITGTEFVDEMTYSGGQHADIYLAMIDVCHQIDEKWGDQFEVLDLWHNEEMYKGITMGDQLWRSYMSDAIHPTKKGYLEWWGPYVNKTIEDMLK